MTVGVTEDKKGHRDLSYFRSVLRYEMIAINTIFIGTQRKPLYKKNIQCSMYGTTSLNLALLHYPPHTSAPQVVAS